jgi:hypothetical protein
MLLQFCAVDGAVAPVALHDFFIYRTIFWGEDGGQGQGPFCGGAFPGKEEMIGFVDVEGRLSVAGGSVEYMMAAGR